MSPQEKKIYFASDFHLGIPDAISSLEREKKIVRWLDQILPDTSELFLMGDLFDFWFEYKKVIPKGYTRLLGKIAEFHDKGIPVHIFTGNHDMWIFDYLPSETGARVYREPITRGFSGKKFYLAHGDGLGPGDHGYKFIKKVFRNKLCQWAFGLIHPDFGIRLAGYFSGKSRLANEESDRTFLGENKEWLVVYSKQILEKQHIDYFLFGHRHLPMEINISGSSKYINLGDWIRHFTYAEFDGQTLSLKTFEG